MWSREAALLSCERLISDVDAHSQPTWRAAALTNAMTRHGLVAGRQRGGSAKKARKLGRTPMFRAEGGDITFMYLSDISLRTRGDISPPKIALQAEEVVQTTMERLRYKTTTTYASAS